MNLKLPKKVRVCGVDYSIVYPYIFDEDVTTIGLHVPSQFEIRISNAYKGKKRPAQRILCTFVHELFHAVDYMHNPYSHINHDDLSAMSDVLFDVLCNNNLCIGKERLPKKVKIGTFYYRVIYPYLFKDEDTIFSIVSTEYLEIRLGGSDLEHKICTQFRDYLFIRGIITAIFYDCIQSHDSKYSDFGSVVGNISNGWCQVLFDNDIVGVVKSA